MTNPLSNNINDLNQIAAKRYVRGEASPYLLEVPYALNAEVEASDDKIYISLTSDNLDNDPTTDGGVNWVERSIGGGGGGGIATEVGQTILTSPAATVGFALTVGIRYRLDFDTSRSDAGEFIKHFYPSKDGGSTIYTTPLSNSHGEVLSNTSGIQAKALSGVNQIRFNNANRLKWVGTLDVLLSQEKALIITGRAYSWRSATDNSESIRGWGISNQDIQINGMICAPSAGSFAIGDKFTLWEYVG